MRVVASGVKSDPRRKPDDDPAEDVVFTLTPKLTKYVRRFGMDRHQAEDVLQDVWVLFLLHRHTIHDPARTHAWLRTTAARHAMRTVNRGRREVPTDDFDRIGDAPDPADEARRAERDEALWRAINRLPERDRRLAWLIADHPELSYAEIALRLGVATNSVGQLRRRCLKRLARLLAREGIVSLD